MRAYEGQTRFDFVLDLTITRLEALDVSLSLRPILSPKNFNKNKKTCLSKFENDQTYLLFVQWLERTDTLYRYSLNFVST